MNPARSGLGQAIDQNPTIGRHSWEWRGYLWLGWSELNSWRAHPASRARATATIVLARKARP